MFVLVCVYIFKCVLCRGRISGFQCFHCFLVDNAYATVERLLSAGAVLHEEVFEDGDAHFGAVIDPYGVLWSIFDLQKASQF